jgi:hypothetical protein
MNGVCLPNGNRDEFPKLEAELRRRGITAVIHDAKGGGRIYGIPDDQVHLLPTDERGPYVGDDKSGHGMYPIDSFIEDYAIK